MVKKTLKKRKKRLSKRRNKTLKRLTKRRIKKRVSKRTKRTKRRKKYKKLRGGMEGSAGGGAGGGADGGADEGAAGGVEVIDLPIGGQCLKQGKGKIGGLFKGDERNYEFDGTLLKFSAGSKPEGESWIVGGENKEWNWEREEGENKIKFTNVDNDRLGPSRKLTFPNEKEAGRLFAALNMYASNTGGYPEQVAHEFLDKASDGKWGEVKEIILTRPTIINAQPSGRCSALHQAAAMGRPDWWSGPEAQRAEQPEFIKFLMVHGANPLATCSPAAEGRVMTPLDLVPDDRENIKRVFVIQMLKPEARSRIELSGYKQEQWNQNLKVLIEKYGIEFVSKVINDNRMFRKADGTEDPNFNGKCWWPTSDPEIFSSARLRVFTEWVQEFVVDDPQHKLLTEQYEADVQQYRSLLEQSRQKKQDAQDLEKALKQQEIIRVVLGDDVDYTKLTKEQMKERLNKTLELKKHSEVRKDLETVYPIFVEVLKKIMDNNPDKKSVLEDVLKEIIADEGYKGADHGHYHYQNLPEYIISYYVELVQNPFTEEFVKELNKYGKKTPPPGFQADVAKIIERRNQLLSERYATSGAGGGAIRGAGGGAGGGAIRGAIRGAVAGGAVAGGAQAQDIYQGNILKFAECYNQGYGPPPWSITVAPRFMKACKVFYNSGENIENIKKLAQFREPVNIAEFGPVHCRQYNQDKLESYFEYREGYYGDCPKSIKEEILCPPNILVYTPTLVTDSPDYSDMATEPTYMGEIHILNAYGLAFDAPHQKDYQLYHGLDEQDCMSKVTTFYENLFTNIFKVAKHLNMETVVMTFVGAGFFSQGWWISDDDFNGAQHLQQRIWVPTLARVKEKYPNIKLLCMGTDRPWSPVSEQLGTTDIGYFPRDPEGNPAALAALISTGELDKTLLINAWDCWSSPGNGNRKDNSVDGHMGANTCIGYLGTGITNPHLLEEENLIALE